jgi:hypothetical protein
MPHAKPQRSQINILILKYFFVASWREIKVYAISSYLSIKLEFGVSGAPKEAKKTRTNRKNA